MLRLRRTVVTCGNAIQVTIYNCRNLLQPAAGAGDEHAKPGHG